jgi:hypothetical protein
VVGLPIQPTTSGAAGSRGSARGTNTVVSTQVGMTVTSRLKRRAYSARYSFPAMTPVLAAMIARTFAGCLRKPNKRLASLVSPTNTASSKS